MGSGTNHQHYILNSMENNLTNTLLDKWNQEKELDNGTITFPNRVLIQFDIENIRTRQVSDGYVLGGSLKEEHEKLIVKDKEIISAYKTLLDWDENYEIQSEWSFEPDDLFYQTDEYDTAEEAYQILSGKKQIEEPTDLYNYGGSCYFTEEGKQLQVSIVNLRLKEASKYQIILEVEKVDVIDGEFNKSEELGFDNVAEDLKDLINAKVPYLNVINAIQEDIVEKVSGS